MPRICEYCLKSTVFGNVVPRKGKSKKKGGNGEHIVKRVARVFRANLLRLKAKKKNGTSYTAKICAKCLKAGKLWNN